MLLRTRDGKLTLQKSACPCGGLGRKCADLPSWMNNHELRDSGSRSLPAAASGSQQLTSCCICSSLAWSAEHPAALTELLLEPPDTGGRGRSSHRLYRDPFFPSPLISLTLRWMGNPLTHAPSFFSFFPPPLLSAHPIRSLPSFSLPFSFFFCLFFRPEQTVKHHLQGSSYADCNDMLPEPN